jgi:hypothetical protein
MLNFEFIGNRPLLQEITSTRLNNILTELRRVRPVAGIGINVQQESNGTRISIVDEPDGGGGGSFTTRQPWDIYVEESEGEGENITYTLKVQPGTASRLLPTNWQDEFEASSGTLYYGIASVATDGRFVTAVTIDITSDAPTNQEAQKYGVDDPVEILFGLFKDGKSYNVAGGRDMPLIAEAVLATSADPPASVGQSPYDIWFRLQ